MEVGNAAKVERRLVVPLPQRLDKTGGGGAGAEAHGHAALDQGRRGVSDEAFLRVGVHLDFLASFIAFEPRRPAGLFDLWRALHGQGVRRHIAGNDRAPIR